MGYRDDFYVMANIVGYTGALNNNPTVYFYIGGASFTFGHITQAHRLAANIGREKVITDPEYCAGNITKDGKEYFFEEWSDGEHPSRTPITWRDDFGPNDINILAQAIRHHTELKKIESMPKQDVAEAVRQAHGGAGRSPTVKEIIDAYENA